MANFNSLVTTVPVKAHALFLRMKMDRLLDHGVPISIEIIDGKYCIYVEEGNLEVAKRLIKELTGEFD